jgi:hypothetical protein
MLLIKDKYNVAFLALCLVCCGYAGVIDAYAFGPALIATPPREGIALQRNMLQQSTNVFTTEHPTGQNVYYGNTNKNKFAGHVQLWAHAPHQPFTQVISDVDDTLKSSGGVKFAEVALGGIDTQYERGEIYPGVMEFILQLSLHSLPNSIVSMASTSSAEEESADGAAFQSATTTIQPAKVAILTARAEEFKVALELKDDSKLGKALIDTGRRSAGLQNWGLGPVLYGSVAEWVIQDRKGLRKFTNFERLLQQDPSGQLMRYIYLGDTGELDQEAGEAMCREYPEVVKAVFLHVVSETPYPAVPPPKLINGRPIVFFRTYVGAAAKAAQLDLMSLEGLEKVCEAAKSALIEIPATDNKWIELEQDLKEAYDTMGLDETIFEIDENIKIEQQQLRFGGRKREYE